MTYYKNSNVRSFDDFLLLQNVWFQTKEELASLIENMKGKILKFLSGSKILEEKDLNFFNACQKKWGEGGVLIIKKRMREVESGGDKEMKMRRLNLANIKDLNKIDDFEHASWIDYYYTEKIESLAITDGNAVAIAASSAKPSHVNAVAVNVTSEEIQDYTPKTTTLMPLSLLIWVMKITMVLPPLPMSVLPLNKKPPTPC